MISFSQVNARYPDSGMLVLDRFDLTVEKGSLTILFGGSGTGKTTIFKLLTCELTPEAGHIAVADMPIVSLRSNDLARYRRSIGIVSQDFELLYDRTVAENIELPLKIKGINRSRRQQRMKFELKRLDLLSKSDFLPKSLSPSERQRVAIARAVITEPFVLLADEPSAHLDRRGEEEIVSILRNENLRGMTVLIGTSSEHLIAQMPEAHIVMLENSPPQAILQ